MRKVILAIAAAILSAVFVSAQDLATATATYNKGAEALALGEKESALNYFNEAMQMGTAVGAEAEELVGNCKKVIPGIVLSIGKDLYNNKNLDGAIAKIQEAVELGKKFGDSDVETEAAELVKQLATQKDLEVAKAALAAKDFPKAVELYNKVLATDSTNTTAALFLGQALSMTGDVAGAEKAFLIAAANGQEDVAKNQLSNLFLKQAAGALKGGKFQDALEAAEKANSYKEDATAYMITGQAAQKLGKNADAISAFEKYVELKPNAKNASAIIFTIGALYQQSGDKAKALENYKKIVNDVKFGAQAKQLVAALSK